MNVTGSADSSKLDEIMAERDKKLEAIGEARFKFEQSVREKMEADPNVAKASYAVPLGDGTQEVTIILPDGTTARAIIERNEILASAAPPLISSD